MQNQTPTSPIRIYLLDTPQYKIIETFCDYLNAHTDARYSFSTQNTYYDARGDWEYTAIIAHDAERRGTRHAWQTLRHPGTYEKMLRGEAYFNEVARAMFYGDSLYDLSHVDEEVGGQRKPHDKTPRMIDASALISYIENNLSSASAQEIIAVIDAQPTVTDKAIIDRDAGREDFMECVYDILSDEPDNIKANLIIDAFDTAMPDMDALADAICDYLDTEPNPVDRNGVIRGLLRGESLESLIDMEQDAIELD